MLASNGSYSGKLEFYCNAEDLSRAGRALTDFPQDRTSEFLWELGSERPEDRYAFYIRFRVFVVDNLGGCAIQIRFNTNEDLPDREIVEFCVTSEASKVNLLGELLVEFAKLEHRHIWWDTKAGALDDNPVRPWAASTSPNRA